MSTVYISPTGSGTRDGSSIENAASIWSLDKMVQKAGAGGTVNLIADQGSYNLSSGNPISISHGGTAAADVTIQGIDSSGQAMNAEIVGTRTSPYSATGNDGADVFRLLSGADHLNFQNLSFTNVGNAFRVGADVSDLSLSHMEANNVQRFFEDYVSGKSTTATITGLSIDDIKVEGFSKGVIRLQYDTNDVTINNVYGDSQHQDGDNFAMGVHLTGTVHDVVVSNTTMLNATDTIHTYWNGDGFTTEYGVYDVTFIDTLSAGNTDGGYDLKSSNTTLIRAVAEDNNRNFRIWSDSVTMIDCVSIDPHHRGGSGGASHVWLAPHASAVIEDSVFLGENSTSTVFNIEENGATVVLENSDIYAISGTTLRKSSATSSLTNTDGTAVSIQAYTPAIGTAVQAAIDAILSGSADGSTDTPVTQITPATFALAPEAASVTEGNSGHATVEFIVTRSGSAIDAATVDYSVAGSGTDAANAADFVNGVLPSGTVTFAAGETSKTISIEVQGDQVVEANESFTLTLTHSSSGSITTGSASVTILNDDVAKVFTVLDRAHAIDLSASTADKVSGTSSHDSFYVDVAASSGKDTITDFGTNDVLLTTKAIYDGNQDGIIAFAKGTTLSVDAPSNKDTITFQQGADSLRSLGQTDSGLHVYAEADVRPTNAIEGTVGDDTLTGSGTATTRTKAFFYDTALDIDLGTDKIVKFGASDLLVTTTKLATSGSVVTVDQSGHFALPGALDGTTDSYVAGEGGSVAITDKSGAAVTTLEYDGTTIHDGVNYYVYSLVGSAVGTADLHF